MKSWLFGLKCTRLFVELAGPVVVSSSLEDLADIMTRHRSAGVHFRGALVARKRLLISLAGAKDVAQALERLGKKRCDCHRAAADRLGLFEHIGIIHVAQDLSQVCESDGVVGLNLRGPRGARRLRRVCDGGPDGRWRG